MRFHYSRREFQFETPQVLDKRFGNRCKTSGGCNRFRPFLGLCYRNGMEDTGITINLAARYMRLPPAHTRSIANLIKALSRSPQKSANAQVPVKLPPRL